MKREITLPWREASPPNHHDDKVDSTRKVFKKELSLHKPVHGNSLLYPRPDKGALTLKEPAFLFVYSSILGDIRLWVGLRLEYLLSTWDLTTVVIEARANSLTGPRLDKTCNRCS